MKGNQYRVYEDQEITKEILDSVEVGDYVKINDWKRPLIVKAVSQNYFIASMPCFESWLYSIFDKSTNLNKHNNGKFVAAPDNFRGKHDYSKESECEIALVELEKGMLELSQRREASISKIQIKKMKAKKSHQETLNDLIELVNAEKESLEFWENYIDDEKLANGMKNVYAQSLEVMKEALENYKNKIKDHPDYKVIEKVLEVKDGKSNRIQKMF